MQLSADGAASSRSLLPWGMGRYHLARPRTIEPHHIGKEEEKLFGQIGLL